MLNTYKYLSVKDLERCKKYFPYLSKFQISQIERTLFYKKYMDKGVS